MKRPIAEILAELRTAEEHLQLEAKKSAGESALETVSAFSNEPDLGGGTLLFGVVKRDGSYEVLGVPSPETLTADLQSQVSDQSLNQAVRPTIWTEIVEGKALVAAFVPEARPADKPIYLRRRGLPRGAYRRIGNGDVQCSDDDLRLFHELAVDTAYEDALAPHASMEDLDTEVIQSYRTAILERNPGSEIRDLTAVETVQAFGCARAEKGVLRPTVAGVLLFARPLALRRIFPMVRVDYIRMPGTAWIEDVSRPIESLDVAQPLLVTFRKIYQAILDDLPKTATFHGDSPERIDVPSIPGRVLREALVNALCHRDYRTHSPTQVIRYSNRIEFRNAGHSLVDEERLGQPGSASRNPRIAGVFREMAVAENKGTGIRVMRREMEAAQLARPLFESSREGHRFVATLLFAHLFTDEQRAWLEAIRTKGLSREQELALVYCREVGQIRNSILRDLTGLDTLAASAALRSLRDAELLSAQGAGSQTHYVLGPAAGTAAPRSTKRAGHGGELAAQGGELSTEAPAQGGELEGQGGELSTEAFAQGGELEGKVGGLSTEAFAQEGKLKLRRAALLASVPDALRSRVLTLPKRASEAHLHELIVDLCAVRPWTPLELSLVLDRSVRKVADKHLAALVREGRLERLYPEAIHHPAQAYRAPKREET